MFKALWIDSREIIQLENDNEDKIRNYSLYTSLQKTQNTIDTWQTRDDNQRLFNIFIGDYAKNIIHSYLRDFLNINTILNYDWLRKDQFRNTDIYDLKSGNIEIEVKSSIEKHSKNLSNILVNRNIIVNLYNAHVSNSDYIFQVFFIPRNLEWFNNLSINDKIYFFNLKNINMYIMGWIENKKQVGDSSFSVENLDQKAKSREYLKSPIVEANNPSSFAKELSNRSIKNHAAS